MKWFAIKRPDGSWIMKSVNSEIHGAWGMAVAIDQRLLEIAASSVRPVWFMAEHAGYRCVEVEIVEAGTADALKRARDAWDVLVGCGAWVDGCPGTSSARNAAMDTLGEVLGRVEAARTGENKEQA